MSDKKHKHKSKDKKKSRKRSRERSRIRRDKDDRSEDEYEREERSGHDRSRAGPSRKDRHRDKQAKEEQREAKKGRSDEKREERNRDERGIDRYEEDGGDRQERHKDDRRRGHDERRRDIPERHERSRSRDHHSSDRDNSPESNDETTDKPHGSAQHTTNLVDFSFLEHKSELAKILTGYSNRDRLVDDIDDFWLFLQKYENLLRSSGHSILPDPIDKANEEIPMSEYRKPFETCLSLTTPFDELYGRISSYSQTAKLSELKVKQFIQIVEQYLDFRQKEKFAKLRKLLQAKAELPVFRYKEEIQAAVRNEQVVLIAGDTGCGKSTQIPQYLYEAGYQSICCTQPRRIACISLSKRVAHEMLCEYTDEVGYQIRFERSKNKNTKIVFLTEGLLLRQLSTEAALTQFDVIVLDEVHERHLHGDFLLGVTKCLLQGRPELKLVLMSATINVSLFAKYFSEEKVHVIEVPGRLFPIKLHYRPTLEDVGGRQSKAERLSPEPYIQIMQMIDSRYTKTEKGDLLIFMSGLTEITTVVDAATEYAEKNKNWIILPLHSSLSIADQDKVFDYAPDGIRKCIVSTNIAETSVTIDGIRFVVDSGKMKEMSYDPQTKMQRLKEFAISKASAKQRMGRAGRTGPGICYRIYSEKTYSDFEEFSQAEIHRVPLEALLLQMISMGLPDARLFPFIEPPAAESIENGLLSLKKHDALTANEKVTPLGRTLSRLPVEISIGKMLLMGCVFQQVQPVLTLAAALSVQSPFTNRAYRDHDCETARKDLESDHGDPITVLNAYKEWLELKRGQFNRQNEKNSKQWCKRRGLEEQRFYEITKLRNQFQDLLKDCDLLRIEGDEKLSANERIIRKGELRQLRQMRREHKFDAPKRRKLKQMDVWSVGHEGEEEDDGQIDIRDIDFRLSHDATKIDNLVSGATACSFRDLMTLKLILVSGLYPQVAVNDGINHMKSPGQQFYHTESKPFTSLHPMSFFGNNPQVLQLTQEEIVDKAGTYRSKLPLSSKHQLLCYLSLLETTKPYLMNTLRMPAAQTLLLFAHSIDTNSTCSQVICDSWLCLDFPQPEAGQSLLYKASNLRRSWNRLLSNKLEQLDKSVESELSTEIRDSESEKLEAELWFNLSTYMNSEILYTLKRLLPADLKTLYVGPSEKYDELIGQFQPNPFAKDFECTTNEVKGGIYITEHILYGSVCETDWSLEMAELIVTTEWTCSKCNGTFNLTGIQKLQHTDECNERIAAEEAKNPKNPDELEPNQNQSSSNTKLFACTHCNKNLYLTAIEILKHKKSCR